MEIEIILENHKKWRKGEGGERANLRYTDLSYTDLSDTDLRYADLSNAGLRYADLSNADMSNAGLRYADLGNADLSGADLRHANLRNAGLSGADLRHANLRNADLRYTDLRNAGLRYADLGNADLSGADLRHADLGNADLSGADLRHANLSGVKELLSPIEWMAENLEKTQNGYIAYKNFDQNYKPPLKWIIKSGQEISETVNLLPTLDCACGVNVSTRNWGRLSQDGVWRVLIKWEWLPGVVVPYNTDGKFRCERILLLEEIN